MNKTCLIITSCIYPFSSFVELKNPKEREHLHILALKRWLNESNFKSIIICDNSDYTYSNELINLALTKGKNLEILSFNGDREKTFLYGKGYGEGELMQYVFSNSELLKEHDSFFKVTGKLFVENYFVYNKTNNSDFIFSYPINFIFVKKALDRIFTDFYYAKITSYKLYLGQAYHKVRDNEGLFLEHVFALRLNELKFKNEKIKINTMYPFPIITGKGGSIGTEYELNPIRNCIKNFLLRTPFVKKV